MALLLIACGAQEPFPRYAASACNGTSYEPLASLELDAAHRVDSIEYRQDRHCGPEGWTTVTLAKVGADCTTDACANVLVERGFEAESASVGGGYCQTRDYLVVVRGSEVRAVTTLAGLAELLGPIDNVHKATLEAFALGYQIQCAGELGSTGEAIPNGWRVTALSGSNCGKAAELDGHVLEIGADASFEVTRTFLVEEGDPECVED